MKRLYWLFAFVLVLSSCKSVAPPSRATDTTVKERDSTATRTEVQDTLLVVRDADMTSLSKRLDELTEEGFTRTSGAATLTLRRNGNQLEAKCECEELKQAVKLYKEIVEFYKSKETTTTTETTVTKKEMPGWAKPFLWLGIGITGLMLVSTILKYKGKII